MIAFSSERSDADRHRLMVAIINARNREDHETVNRLEEEWCRPETDADTALLDRLATDLNRYPNSQTLKALDATGGCLINEEGTLSSAYRNGAPAVLIAEAETLRTAISNGTTVLDQVRLSAKLAHRLTAVNRGLAKYGVNRAVATARIFRPLTHPTAPVAELIAENDDDPTTGPYGNDLTTARPPPIKSPASMPLNRNAPPHPWVQQQTTRATRPVCTLGFDGAGGT